MVCYSHLFQNFPQFIVTHTVQGFGTVNKAEIDVFLELSWCPTDKLYFSSPQPSVSRLALLHLRQVDPSLGSATLRTADWVTQNLVTGRGATGAITVVSKEDDSD